MQSFLARRLHGAGGCCAETKQPGAAGGWRVYGDVFHPEVGGSPHKGYTGAYVRVREGG